LNRHILKVSKCGSADSKYFSNPQQFDKDIEKNIFDDKLFKAKVRALVLEDPSKMDIRYHQVIDVMMEIKAEFGL